MIEKKIFYKLVILIIFIFSLFFNFSCSQKEKKDSINTRNEVKQDIKNLELTPNISVSDEKTLSPENIPLQVSPVATDIVDQNMGLIKILITDIRGFPSDNSELVSQAVMGEEVIITGEENKWFKIELVNQFNYPGWVRKDSVIRGKKYSNSSPLGVVIASRTSIFKKPDVKSNKIVDVLLGSIIEIIDIRGGFFLVTIPDETTGWIKREEISTKKINKKENIINTAFKMKNVFYLWGGMTEVGIDCSGLVHMIYRANGIKIHRDADLQYLHDGKKISSNVLQEGDLLFFEEKGEICHVGMYIGEGKFIHSSPNPGKVGIDYLKSSYYYPSFAGAKRILSE